MSETTEHIKTEDELAHERLMSVQDQMFRKVPTGYRRKILCPYCGHWNVRKPNENLLCCNTLRKAIIAILSGRRALKMAEAAERAQNN